MGNSLQSIHVEYRHIRIITRSEFSANLHQLKNQNMISNHDKKISNRNGDRDQKFLLCRNHFIVDEKTIAIKNRSGKIRNRFS
jgi:hypothetical protein